MKDCPRVAFFADSFHEVNGVAHTSRQLEAFAQRRGLPFLCVHSGPATRHHEGSTITRLELRRSPVSFALDANQDFDFLLWRHLRLAQQAVRDFRADLIHLTGPSDVGQLGAYVAHSLGLPLVASWHTNLHEFAARRFEKLVSRLPRAFGKAAGGWVERQSLRALLRFYRIPRVLFRTKS